MDDQNAELPAQLDAEIDRLRRERPKDEANPDCAEIDSNITALQCMHGKVINASGGGTFTSVGHAGELLDIEVLREDKTWRVAPVRVEKFSWKMIEKRGKERDRVRAPAERRLGVA
jgi:hypothetical protein